MKKLLIFRPNESSLTPIPSPLSLIPAGFPSPADDFLEPSLNLHELMIKHPAATFFVKVVGDSMQGAGIHCGDILVVDRSLEPHDGKIVVAVINGEFTVKRIRRQADGKLFLLAENPDYPPLQVSEESNFQVWGVVTYAIHKT
jgi:DNA polymerase V